MKKLGLALIAGGALWLIAWLSVYEVSESDVVIITRFGRPTQVVDRAGPHLKFPGFLEKVNRLDKRIQSLKTRPLQLLLGDKNPIVVTCYVSWKIKNPLEFFQSVTSTEIAEQKLSDMLNARLGSALGEYSIGQIINSDPGQVKLDEIEGRIREECNRQAVRDYGLEVVDVGIRRLAYPEIVAEAVYARMQAEREKEAKKYRAEGAEAAAKIEAEADRESAKILSDAYRQAEIIRGEGESEAMKIYGEAYGQGKEFYEFWGALETYKKILGQQTTLILSSQSALFRHLLPPPEKNPTPEPKE